MAIANSPSEDFQLDSAGSELLAGLRQSPPSINPKYFYDETGSDLFTQICDVPEYYPTRTEVGIFKQRASEIATAVGPIDVVIEPGAGNCEKIGYLLEDLNPQCYLPVDISAEYLQQASAKLRLEFPLLEVKPVAADFSQDFELPDYSPRDRRLLFCPGSTIGNFTPPLAREFLQRCAELLGSGGGLLIGVDLHKEASILEAAYNDSAGVTAQFNLNILANANRLLNANFDQNGFQHRSFYNEQQRRIEMHLDSTRDQSVDVHGDRLFFAAGDSIHTEYSYKYSREDFCALADSAGYSPRGYWSDEREWFSVHYFEVN
jgi:L-histidine Nalpha-methyltransferase